MLLLSFFLRASKRRSANFLTSDTINIDEVRQTKKPSSENIIVDDLIDKNTLLRNRARQASITNELIEIISGAEAV